MTRSRFTVALLFAGLFCLSPTPGLAQPDGPQPDGERPDGERPDGAQPPEGGGPPRWGFGRGLMGRSEVKLVKKFDEDENGWLDRQELQGARESLKEQAGGGRGRGSRGGPRGLFGGGDREPPQPGPKLSPADVPCYPDAELYDTSVLRTIFLEFDSPDWEAEMADFKPTDVEVPATLIVDGRTYPNVGVSFRGMSSFMMVPAGYKRSLNVSLNLTDKDQRLYGYKTLNLLNGNGDPSMMSAVLYSHIARQHIPAPRANFVRVVINGGSWGVYCSVQQFDKVFTEENFGASEGTRWKVPGRPGGDGGLRYTGADLAEYKSRYDMKSNDGEPAWQALVELCRTLNETPDDELVERLAPILDIDQTLWFLALDVALVNSDGYWTRASDYSIFRDKNERFHLIPHDMNEALQAHGGPGGRRGPGGFGPPPGFGPPNGLGPQSGPPPGFGPPPERFAQRGDIEGIGQRPSREEGRSDQRGNRRGRWGRGFGGGPGHGGPDLDPLIGLDNDRTPLRGRLLALPNLRERYLKHVRDIAQTQLDWQNLGPLVAQQRELIEEAVKADTKMLSGYQAFDRATSPDAEGTLRGFIEARREYLLNYEPPALATSEQ